MAGGAAGVKPSELRLLLLLPEAAMRVRWYLVAGIWSEWLLGLTLRKRENEEINGAIFIILFRICLAIGQVEILVKAKTHTDL